MVIYLVGFMASGKSTIGKLIGENLNIPYTDLDLFIQEQAGMTIPEIFEIEGEEGFRIRETKALFEAPRKGVIATGGGIVTVEKNRAFLKDKPVVYLKASFPVLEERLSRNPGERPLVDSELKMRYYSREPLYQEVATFVIDTDNKTPIEIVEEVYMWMSR